MSNYKEVSLSGTEYQRAKAVVIQNRYNGDKKITYFEEKLKVLNDGTVLQEDVGTITEPFNTSNATEQFQLLNPVDNTVIGSSTYQEAYAVLYSLYIHLANKRDAV